MKRISLRLPVALNARLTALDRRRGLSRSALVREALEAWLSTPEAGSLSVNDLVSDLVGSVEGPGDLSINPRHMEGYGR